MLKMKWPFFWVITVLLAVVMVVGACNTPVNLTPPAVDEVLPEQEQDTTQAAPTPVVEQSNPEERSTPEEMTPTEQAPSAETPQVTVTINQSSFPNPADFSWNAVAEGLDSPVEIGNPNDGSNRLLILEKRGVIRIFQNGSLLNEPFMDITDRVVIGGNEMGLLGIAFHPKFAENGYFYVNYTAIRGVGETHISRFQVSASNSNQADTSSEKLLLKVDQPYRNHNGGGLAFGPDGFLYIGMGDGGSANDPLGNGQSLNTHLGKMLRIDVDNGEPYAIPADNPYIDGGGLPEIWASGLRNPWRFSFDRITGDLWIADVGQNQWEEVNFTPAGTPGGINFGWDYREASYAFEGSPPADIHLIDPVFEYDHSLGCSVTGGFVYRGSALPEFSGVYLVGDFCTGRIWGVIPQGDGAWASEELFVTNVNISSFGQDGNGELYFVDLTSGTLFRLERK